MVFDVLFLIEIDLSILINVGPKKIKFGWQFWERKRLKCNYYAMDDVFIVVYYLFGLIISANCAKVGPTACLKRNRLLKNWHETPWPVVSNVCISLNATARSGVKGTYGTDLTTIDFYCTISSYFMCLAWAKGAVVSLVERVSDVEKASLNIHSLSTK